MPELYNSGDWLYGYRLARHSTIWDTPPAPCTALWTEQEQLVETLSGPFWSLFLGHLDNFGEHRDLQHVTVPPHWLRLGDGVSSTGSHWLVLVLAQGWNKRGGLSLSPACLSTLSHASLGVGVLISPWLPKVTDGSLFLGQLWSANALCFRLFHGRFLCPLCIVSSRSFFS